MSNEQNKKDLNRKDSNNMGYNRKNKTTSFGERGHLLLSGFLWNGRWLPFI